MVRGWPLQTQIIQCRYGIPELKESSSPIAGIQIVSEMSPGRLTARGSLQPAMTKRYKYGPGRKVTTSSPIAAILIGQLQWHGLLMEHVSLPQVTTRRCRSGRQDNTGCIRLIHVVCH